MSTFDEDVKNFLKKSFYTGMGLISMSKDAIVKAAEKLKEELKLSEEEGKKFTEEVAGEAEKAKKNFQEEVEKAVNKTMDKLNLAKKDEVDELKKKIDELEKKLKTK